MILFGKQMLKLVKNSSINDPSSSRWNDVTVLLKTILQIWRRRRLVPSNGNRQYIKVNSWKGNIFGTQIALDFCFIRCFLVIIDGIFLTSSNPFLYILIMKSNFSILKSSFTKNTNTTIQTMNGITPSCMLCMSGANPPITWKYFSELKHELWFNPRSFEWSSLCRVCVLNQ